MARLFDAKRRSVMVILMGWDILRAMCVAALSLGLIRILGLG